jgi:8-oxo-dGTP pyrophosphatase MutT (NUDIX family)
MNPCHVDYEEVEQGPDPEPGGQMDGNMGSQDKIATQAADLSGARMQYGALCWRPGASGVEILLITSRDTGRWVIPKGWPMPGLAPEAAAAQEAWEEAGVEGEMEPVCLGRYGYQKCLTVSAQVPCAVAVYGLRVQREAEKFPEVKERSRQWVAQPEAALMVNEPDLGALIAGFVPPVRGRPAPIAADDGATRRPTRRDR